MSKRHFTPEEVNRLIPKLAELMETAMDRHRRALELGRALGAEHERIRVSGGGLIDPQEWKARADRLEGLAAEVRAAVQEILALGGVTKDLELGLVDFPGLLPGAEAEGTVNLCWKYGEGALGFWHGLDEGYAQRKPLP
jgi:hypothetical protein